MNKVDAYIASFPPEVQKTLKEIRATIKKAAPEAEETIVYRMPAYKYKGKYIIFFAAFKHHIGIYPLPDGIKHFQKELSEYKTAKGSVQFPLDKPFPFDLIKRIVEFRLK